MRNTAPTTRNEEQRSVQDRASRSRFRPCRRLGMVIGLLLSGLSAHSVWAQAVDCPTITNSQLSAVRICSGKVVDSLQVLTTAPSPYTIEFVRFDRPYENPYKGQNGVHLGEVTPVNGRVTQRAVEFPANTGTTDTVYYVYACLKPEPTNPACIPFALITVTVAPCHCPPQQCVPIVIRKVKSGLGTR